VALFVFLLMLLCAAIILAVSVLVVVAVVGVAIVVGMIVIAILASLIVISIPFVVVSVVLLVMLVLLVVAGSIAVEVDVVILFRHCVGCVYRKEPDGSYELTVSVPHGGFWCGIIWLFFEIQIRRLRRLYCSSAYSPIVRVITASIQ
jgi:hypothetical protein